MAMRQILPVYTQTRFVKFADFTELYLRYSKDDSQNWPFLLKVLFSPWSRNFVQCSIYVFVVRATCLRDIHNAEERLHIQIGQIEIEFDRGFNKPSLNFV